MPEWLWKAMTTLLPHVKDWFAREPKPRPVITVAVTNDKALIDIENVRGAGTFTAEILMASNVEEWPDKTVWARWDHDKNAKSVQIPSKTSAKVRIAKKLRRDGEHLKWMCFFGTDHAMGQTRMARSNGDDNRIAKVILRIVWAPPSRKGPVYVTVFLGGDGSIFSTQSDVKP